MNNYSVSFKRLHIIDNVPDSKCLSMFIFIHKHQFNIA